MFVGQARQDEFVLNVMKYKKNGFFVEIGSGHPSHHNNTYISEKNYSWKGIMIEQDHSLLDMYKQERKNSIHIINDATKIDYKDLFKKNNVPFNVDYLQIDLEVSNGSTLNTLIKIDNEVMDNYKFATITFEHDIYRSNYMNTRAESRKIFEKRGYVRAFSDVNHMGKNPFEDWYVYPDLVDMTYINKLIIQNDKNYKQKPVVEKSINWQDIKY